ncbi:MAG: hypothetical protein EBR40_01870 [Proteobacteria bacterium]|nr:hypothetical protein [Pseudomonadota bacterium]
MQMNSPISLMKTPPAEAADASKARFGRPDLLTVRGKGMTGTKRTIGTMSMISRLALMTLVAVGMIPKAKAVTYYWTATGTNTWGTAFWSTTSTSGGTTGVNPGVNDTVVFNQSTINGSTVVNLSGNTSVAGMIFNNTGATTITNQTPTIGSSGITINAGAGAVTLTRATIGVSQTWLNNSSSLFTLSNAVGGTTAVRILTVDGSGNFSLIANITSGGSLVKTGTGTLSLGQMSANAGNYTLNNGTLNLTNVKSFGTTTSSLTIYGGSLDGNAVVQGTNAITINTDFAFIGSSGNLSITNGTVSLGTAAGTSRTITVNANTLTLGGVISNGTTANSLIKSGAGALSLTGANTYSGGTTINAGTLVAGNNAAFGTGDVTFVGNSTVTNSGSVSIANNYAINSGILATFGVTASTAITNTGVISGSGSLSKVGTGTLALSGNNTFQGGVTLSAGQLNLNSSTALGTGTLTIGGGTLDNTSGSAIINANNNSMVWNGSFGFAGSSDLNLGTGAVTNTVNNNTITVSGGNLTVGGVINGYGFTKAGGGTLTLGGANTFIANSGGEFITLSGGALKLANNLALSTAFSGNTTQLKMADGTTLDLNGTAVGATGGGVISDSGNKSHTITNSSAANASLAMQITTGANSTNAFTFGVGAGNITFTGKVSGTGPFNKTGTGTLVLGATGTTNASFYQIQAGAVELTTANFASVANATAGSNVVIASGATLHFNGQSVGATNRGLTIAGVGSDGKGVLQNSSATSATNSFTNLLTGNSTIGVGTGGALTFSGTVTDAGAGGGYSLTKVGSGSLILNASNSYAGGTLINSGTLAIGNSNALGTGTVTFASNSTLAGVSNTTFSNNIAINTEVAGTFSETGVTMTNSGVISGQGTLVQNGTGTLVLSGNNTYSGGTLVSNGTLSFASAGNLGTGTVTLSGTSGGQAVLNNTAVSGTTALSGLTFNGYGTLVLNSGAVLTATNIGLSGTGNLISYNGSFSQGTTNTVLVYSNAIGGSIDPTLLSITGSAVGGTVQLNTTSSGIRSSVTFTNTGNSLQLITGAFQNANLAFSGASGAWDTNTANWTAYPSGVAGQTFYSGDSVWFTNAANVAVSGSGVSAANMTIANGSGTVILGVGTITANTFTNSGAGNAVLSNSLVLNGNGTLVQNGSGTLSLLASNSYSGGSTLNSGALALSNAYALGSGAVSVTGSGTISSLTNLSLGNNFVINNGASATFTEAAAIALTNAGNFTGTGTLAQSGGTLVQSGSLASGLNLNIASGTMNLANGNQTVNDVTIGNSTLSGNGTLTANSFTATNTGAATISNALAGSASFTQNGTGTTTFRATNTYTGGLFVNAGAVQTVHLTSAGGYQPTGFGGGTITLGATSGTNNAAILNSANGGSITNTIFVQGGSSNNTLVVGMNGASSGYSGNIILSNNLTVFNNATQDGKSSSWSSTFSGAGNLTIANSNVKTNTGLTLSGPINMIGSILHTGSSSNAYNTISGNVGSNVTSVTQNSATTALILTGSNNFQNLTITSGTVLDAGTNALAGVVVDSSLFNSGLKFQTNISTFNLGGLSGSDSVAMTNSTNGSINLAVGGAGSNNNFSGSLSGSGTLIKYGSGTQTLTGSNSYSGGTVVNTGQLTANSTNAFGTGNLAVSGGVLDLGNNTFTNTIVASGGTIQNGTLSNNTSFELSGGTISANLAGNAALTNSSGTTTLSGSNSYTGGTAVNGGTVLFTSNNSLGSGGVSLANGTGLTYSGASATTLANNISVTSGTGTIQNSTANLLTLSGNLIKNGTILQLYRGSYNVTGVISGSNPNSDLYLNNASVTLSNAATFNGGTKLFGASTLTAGVSSAIPSGSFLTVGGTDEESTVTNTVNLAGYSQTISGLASGTGGVNQILNSSGTYTTLSISGSGSDVFGGSISGNMGLRVQGGKVLNLTGDNGYTGTTTIEGDGTKLNLGSTGALSGTSNVVVSAGSTFLLGASDRVTNTAKLTLNGGTLSMGGNGSTRAGSQTFNSLTLTGNSVIDFSSLSGTSSIIFGSMAMGSYTLKIYNYDLSSGTHLYDTLSRTGTDSGLKLGNIRFYSGLNDVGFLGTGNLLAGEIVPVPEPSVIVTAALILGWFLFSQRKLLGGWIRNREETSLIG